MLPKPACYGEQYASAFQERGVVAAYQYRPPYPDSMFALLADLIADSPRRVLDVGCGTGFIARPLVELVGRVDALDVSQAMIEEGRRLPNGDHPRLTWLVGRAEDAPLTPPYDLITAGDSLHWMDWEVVLPRFARLLAPDGALAIIQNGQLPVVQLAGLLPIIQKYSIYGQAYQPVDLIEELERRKLFQTQGAVRTDPVPFAQSIDAYVESFHGRASLARERMTPADAAAFDAEVRELVATYTQDSVELQLVADIAWGKPLNPAAQG